MENISWKDAQKFCELLAKRKLPKTVQSVSLPTETQWEYACRAGTQTAFHFGDVFNGTQGNCRGNYPYGSTSPGPYLGRTTWVDTNDHKPNAFGLHQMHGNVLKWCLDGFDPRTYQKHEKWNPFIEQGEEKRHVLRGGHWDYNAGRCRSAIRSRARAESHLNHYGFRIILLLDES